MSEKIFKFAVEKALSDVDDFIPCKNILEAQKLKPLALVGRTDKSFIFQKFKYKVSRHHLKEVCNFSTRSAEEIHISPVGEPWAYNETFNLEVSGSISGVFKDIFEMKASAKGELSFTVNFSSLQTESVDQQTLIDCLEDSTLEVCHPLIRSMVMSDKLALCIVTSVVRCQEDTELVSELSVQSSADAKATVADSEGGVSAEVSNKKSKSQLVPKGTVLAYQVVELQVDVETGVMEVVLSKKIKGGFGRFNYAPEEALAATMLGSRRPPRRGKFLRKKRITILPLNPIKSSSHGTGYPSTYDYLGDVGVADGDIDSNEVEIFEEDHESDSDEENGALLVKEIVRDLSALQAPPRELVAAFLRTCQDPRMLKISGSIVDRSDQVYRENIEKFLSLDIPESLEVGGHDEQRVIKAVLMVAVTLSTLGEQMLYFLSQITPEDVKLVHHIIEKTLGGEGLAMDNPLFDQLQSASQALSELILVGLDYKYGEGSTCLLPPKNKDCLKDFHMSSRIFISIYK